MSSLVLRGGEVLDPDTGRFDVRDVRLDGAAVGEGGARDGDRIIDVTGLLVTPGLVDLHTHVFSGQDLGVGTAEPLRGGTTTVIDTGSAGGHLIGAFRSSVADAPVRIRAFLNIASVGTTSILLSGELMTPAYADEDVAVEAAEANRDLVIGIKVRASADVGGEHATEALHRARRAADRTGLPLMVHLGPAPAAIDEIAGLLKGGDILTHSFSGWAGNAVIDDGAVRPAILAARERGVLLDVGHGMSGFDPGTARTMLALGQPPDTISTDLHTYSRELVVDLPTVLSKFIALGMQPGDALTRATLAPARAAGLDSVGVGRLRAGGPADVAVLKRVEGAVDLGGIPTSSRLQAVLTIAAGRVMWDPEGMA